MAPHRTCPAGGGAGERLPLSQQPSGAVPTLTPAAPTAPALPVQAYHGWQKYAGKTHRLLSGGHRRALRGLADLGRCAALEGGGGDIVVMGGPNGPDSADHRQVVMGRCARAGDPAR